MTYRGTRRRAAFTLIEILAVVAIFALIAAFVAPNLGAVRARSLREEARRLSAHLELARQRSVVTGVPHRVYLDLEGGAYRLEWLAPSEQPSERPLEPEYDLRGQTPIPMSPPTDAARSYGPAPGLFGRLTDLDPEVEFAGIETPEGWIDRGEAYVSFEGDGTASHTSIVLEHENSQLALDVLPLADAVRIRDETR